MPLWQGNNPIEFGPGSIKSIVAWYDNSSVDTIISSEWQNGIIYSFRTKVIYNGIYYTSLQTNTDLIPEGPIPAFNSAGFYESQSIVVGPDNKTYRARTYIIAPSDPPDINTSDWEYLFDGNDIRNIWAISDGPNVTRWRDKTVFNNTLKTDFVYNIPTQTKDTILSNNSICTLNSILTNNRSLEFQTRLSGATIFCVASINLSDQALNTTSSTDSIITNFVSVFANSVGTNTSSNNMTIGCHIYSNTGSSSRTVRGLIYDNRYSTYSNLRFPPTSSNIHNNLITGTPQLFTGLISNGGNDMALYFNGSKIMSNSSQNILTSDINNFNIFIGDSSNYTASISGSIAGSNFRHASASSFKEVIVYSSKLSEADISGIHSYLQAKHNLPPLANDGNFTY